MNESEPKSPAPSTTDSPGASDHREKLNAAVPTLSNVFAQTQRDDNRPAIWSIDGKVTWGALASEYDRQFDRLRHLLGDCTRQRIGFRFRQNASGFATLAALQQLGGDVFVFDPSIDQQRFAEWSQQLSLDHIVDPEGSHDRSAQTNATSELSGDDETIDEGSITLLTSGTTGQPKAVRHSWDGLSRPVRMLPNGDRQRWLLAFRPHLYAGLQVTFQAMLNRSCLVLAPPDLAPMDAATLLAKAGVEYASATPSYWRRLLMLVPPEVLSEIPLIQITLGGEVSDQAILDRLSSLYPTARLIHIYATTEMGRCFSVSDRKAGFPVGYVEKPTPDGVELKVADGQLWVRSANAMLGYDQATREVADPDQRNHGRECQEWFPTKDLVEQQGDRYVFVGRSSDMINVGGNKVYPVAVERIIRDISDVDDVRVYGIESSVAGQLVACQVVPKSGANEDELRRAVTERCREQLDRYACPRLIEVLDELPLTQAGKLQR